MIYDESWDRPHTPGGDARWQESDCYWFYDAAQRVGGFHRIGQRPRQGHGHGIVFAFAENGERFFQHGEVTIAADDRSESGQRVGISAVEALGMQRMRYAWTHADSEAELRFEEGFYTPRSWTRSDHGGAVGNRMNAEGHLECSGRIRGRLRIGAREYAIDALAHRDRSWGARDVSMSLQHRMCSGTLGPELSWAAFALQLRDHGWHSAGFVVRSGEELQIRKLQLLATSDHDGFTVVGGHAQLELENGETLELPCRVRQGCVNRLNDYVWTDNIATVRHAGREGICDLEIAANPRRGTHAPSPTEAGACCVDQGVSAAADYDAYRWMFLP